MGSSTVFPNGGIVKYSELNTTRGIIKTKDITKPTPTLSLKEEIYNRLPINRVGFFICAKHKFYRRLIKRWLKCS